MAETEEPRKLFAGAGMAALRQGAKELATALKPLPDSISIDEPGGPLHPTQGEIADVNRNGSLWGRVQQGRERADAGKDDPDKGRDRE